MILIHFWKLLPLNKDTVWSFFCNTFNFYSIYFLNSYIHFFFSLETTYSKYGIINTIHYCLRTLLNWTRCQLKERYRKSKEEKYDFFNYLPYINIKLMFVCLSFGRSVQFTLFFWVVLLYFLTYWLAFYNNNPNVYIWVTVRAIKGDV